MFRDYLITAYTLAHKYRDRITILVGCESEYISPSSLIQHKSLFSSPHSQWSSSSLPTSSPSYLSTSTLYSTLNALKPSYTVGSVHHLFEIPIDFDRDTFKLAFQQAGSYDKLYGEYFDAQYTLLTALHPEVVGHFDLVRLFTDDSWDASVQLQSGTSWRDSSAWTETVWNKVKRNVEYVIAYGGLFEVNSRAWKKGLEGYPCLAVVKLIQSHNGRFTLSDDSHGRNDVGLYYNELYGFLKKAEINDVWYLEYEDLGKSDGTDGSTDNLMTTTDIISYYTSRKLVQRKLENVLECSFWKTIGAGTAT